MFKNLEPVPPVPVVIFLLNVSKTLGTGESVEFEFFWGKPRTGGYNKIKEPPNTG
jgi:hypothetical protein